MELVKHDVKGVLNVVGEGEVKAKPDVAVINLGVMTEEKTARDAIASNAARMEKVVGKMRALGLPPDDVKTQGFNLSPIIDYTDKSPTYGQVIRYRVENTLAVTVEPSRAGVVIDEAMQAGANTAGQLAFGLKDQTTPRATALRAAMQAAMDQAQMIATTMRVEIIGINSIDTSYGGQPVFRSMMKSAEGPATPIEAGMITISAQTTVAYAITTHR